MTDASTQTNQDALANDNSSPNPFSDSETAKKTLIETPIQTNKDDVVDSSSNGSPSLSTTLVNTPTDPSSPVDAGHNEHEEAEFEDVQEPQSTNQELRDENAQLKSSMNDLARALSQEIEKSRIAEERATAVEGRAATAEARVAVVAARATNLSTHMEHLSQDLGTQVTRAANAEAETMRARLEMWGMQRGDFLASDDEPIPDQHQLRNDLDQIQEEKNVSRSPDALEPAEGHEVRDTPIEKTAGVFQDVAEDHAAASPTPIEQEDLLSAKLAAHQQTREELAQLKEQMTAKDRLLNSTNRLLRDVRRGYEELEQLQTDLQEELDEANLRISELESSTGAESLMALEFRIITLKVAAAQMLEMLANRDDIIRRGTKELNFFIRLGTKLYTRLRKAEKLLKGALGRDDGLMRLAEQRLPIPVPAEIYSPDIVDENVDSHEGSEPKIQLTIEGPPADLSAMQNLKTDTGYEEESGEVDTQQLVSDMLKLQDGGTVDSGDIADVEAEGPVSNNADFQNAEDVASPGVSIATSEDTLKDPVVPVSLFEFGTPNQSIEPEVHYTARKSGFMFSLEPPVQETRKATEDTVKKPVFAFGGTSDQESQQKAKITAKESLFQFPGISVQENRQETPPGATTPPQGFDFPQQTAAPDVSDVQEDEWEWNDFEDEDHKDEANDQKGATERVLGKYEVTRDHASANEPHTPKAKRNATAINRRVKEPRQDLKFGGAAPIFGAPKTSNPDLNSNAGLDSSNFAPKTEFNFGATNTFKAGPNPFTAGSKVFRAANEDEQKEGPSKRNKTASKSETTSSINLSPSSLGTKGEESNKEKKTPSIFETAAGISLSSTSSGSKKEASKKTKTASIFDAAASVDLSSPSSDNGAAIDASVDHEPKGASQNPKFTFTGGSKFLKTAAKDECKKQEQASEIQTTSMSGAGTSNQFSFSPGHVAPKFGGFNNGLATTSNAPPAPFAEKKKPVEVGKKDEQKQGSTKKLANAPLFTADAFAKFGSQASGEKTKFDGFKFGTTVAPKVRTNTSSSALSFGRFATKPLSQDTPLTAKQEDENLQRAIALSFETARTALAMQEPTYIYPVDYEDRLVVRRPLISVSDLGGIPIGHDAYFPDPCEDSASLYEIEDGYEAPTKDPVKVDQVEREPASAIDSADTAHGESESSEPTQGSSSILLVQQEVPGTPNDEVSHTTSTPPSTSGGRVEGEAADVLGMLGFDVAALTRIVDSVTPAIEENLTSEDLSQSLISGGPTSASQVEANEVGGDRWQGSRRTAAEIIASWEAEYRERAARTLTDEVDGQEPPTASIPWREPAWPAALPPLGVPEPEWFAELPPLAATPTTPPPPASAQAAVTNSGANYSGTFPTASPVISKISAHMLETAPMTMRSADGHSNLIEVGAIEGGIRYAMGAMKRLYIGPAAPPAMLPNFDTEVHFLSGDWIARRYTIRCTMQRQASDIEPQVHAYGDTLTRTEAARGPEIIREEEPHLEQEIAGESEPHVAESPTLSRTDTRDVARFLTLEVMAAC